MKINRMTLFLPQISLSQVSAGVISLLLALALGSAFDSRAHAQGTHVSALVNAKIAMHVQEVTPVETCGANLPSSLNCQDFDSPLNVSWPADGTMAHVYLLIIDVDPETGTSGASFGIEYGNMIMGAWQGCADKVFPENAWPASGSGATFSFDECQNTVDEGAEDAFAVLGYFLVWANEDDVFFVTQRNYQPKPDFEIFECSGNEIAPNYPRNAGNIGFGSSGGYAPCIEDVPVESTTWGTIKRLSAN
ncbi:MAG: hypothetical protein HKN21_04960 [Candidatus Eisenbacteria bacterium]|uniref:Uncharacterized protein n=1 Tax=Eiseniibacteriota bacterium TaxID=2212470 RepID=A0A7Y2E6F1_UNCEI|nr:hypothetical protein [Candidatus Eisenbacteria bacterium]